MNTIAWVLILSAGLVFRAVARGRVMNIPQDLADGFLAIVNGNTSDLKEVLARTGDSNTPSFDAGDIGTPTAAALTDVGNILKSPAVQQGVNKNIAATAVSLGSKARGYRYGATGPDYYDCSGLVWRAVQQAGYHGPRFVTSTVLASPGFHQIPASAVTTGDIVLWPAHHMGVYVGPDKMYSARNPKAGINTSSISTFRPDPPIYVRYTGL